MPLRCYSQGHGKREIKDVARALQVSVLLVEAMSRITKARAGEEDIANLPSAKLCNDSLVQLFSNTPLSMRRLHHEGGKISSFAGRAHDDAYDAYSDRLSVAAVAGEPEM